MRKSTCLPVRFSHEMKLRSQSLKRKGTPKSRNGRVRSTVGLAPPTYQLSPQPSPFGVEEVVRLPGVRREHDRDLVLPEHARPQDQRRVADPSVARVHAQEVEAALGDTGGADLDVVDRAAAGRPGELHGRRDRYAAGAQVVHGRLRHAREREELQPHALGVGGDPDGRRPADRVAAGEEAGVDSLHADDQPARQPVPPWRLVAVDATAAVRAGDGEPDEIRAVGRRPCGTPDDRRARLQAADASCSRSSAPVGAPRPWQTTRTSTVAARSSLKRISARSRKPSPFGLTVASHGVSPAKGVPPFETRSPSSRGGPV